MNVALLKLRAQLFKKSLANTGVNQIIHLTIERNCAAEKVIKRSHTATADLLLCSLCHFPELILNWTQS